MKLDNDGDWLFAVLPYFIAVVGVIILLCFVSVAYILIHFGPDAIDWIAKYGVQGLWCGRTGCGS